MFRTRVVVLLGNLITTLNIVSVLVFLPFNTLACRYLLIEMLKYKVSISAYLAEKNFFYLVFFNHFSHVVFQLIFVYNYKVVACEVVIFRLVKQLESKYRFYNLLCLMKFFLSAIIIPQEVHQGLL